MTSLNLFKASLTSFKASFFCLPSDEPVLRGQIFWDNIVIFKNSFRLQKTATGTGEKKERGKDRHDYLDDILFFVLSIMPLFFSLPLHLSRSASSFMPK